VKRINTELFIDRTMALCKEETEIRVLECGAMVWIASNEFLSEKGINQDKKRIKTGLFIDRTAALSKGETEIRDKTNKRDLKIVILSDECIFVVQNCYDDIKWCGNEVITCLEMSLTGFVIKI